MAMNKLYSRINWENEPSGETPLNESNLNKMDSTLDELDNRVINLDTTRATKVEVSELFSSVEYNESTGVITFTRKNGSQITIDTKLEKLAINFAYDPVEEKLIITLDDGTKQYVDLSALITEYEFIDSDTIAFAIEGGKVKAIVKEGSIQGKHLRPDYLADITVQANIASQKAGEAASSAASAKQSENTAKSWAEKAQEKSGVNYASKDLAGVVSPQDIYVDPENGKMELTKRTTDRTLSNSYPGGIKINEVAGKSEQYSGTITDESGNEITVPNPDYPQEIKSVEAGEIKSVGKNLFDKTNDLSDVFINTSVSKISESSGYHVAYAKIEPNKTYTISKKEGTQFRIATFENIPTLNGDKYINSVANHTGASITFISESNANYVAIGYWQNSDGTNYSEMLDSIQLEEGTEVTTYFPYTSSTITLSSPITLRGIGDAKDRIVRKDGVWGVERGIDILNIANSEVVENRAGGGGHNFYIKIEKWDEGTYVKRMLNALCTDFYYDNRLQISVNSFSFRTVDDSGWSGISRILFKVPADITTVEAFKEYVGNDCFVCYEKKEPTFEPLPEADQIALNTLKSFDTVTYISTDSEIEPVIDLEYGTSRVGALALETWNTAQRNEIRITELTAATLVMNQE